MRRNGGTSSLNSPVNYRESSSSPSLSPPDASHPASRDDFTPTPTGSTSKTSVPKKRKPRDPDKPPKPRKPRVPKNPSDSPSKTHVNRFKQHLGPVEMVRTVSESGFASGGSSAMARVPPPSLSSSISSAFIGHVSANE